MTERSTSSEQQRKRDPSTNRPDQGETLGGSGIPVVGIGGSAGALDSLKRFFSAMPPDSGAAFVIVQHLAPTHASMLREILAQHTRMQTFEAQEGTAVQPNCAYVIPPNSCLSILHGVLHLSEPEAEHGIRMPIDLFSRSLAEDRKERAIFVLFSGADADGTLGVRAVRGAGGLTIAQDETAQFSEMPRSAVATGFVDLILPPEQMPKAIMDYLNHSYVRREDATAGLQAEGNAAGLNKVLRILHAQMGHDFRCYKQSTILRRIQRRMGLKGISEIAGYSALIAGDTEEIKELDRDLLINVTSFFRDPDAFEELHQKAIIPLVQAKHADDSIRVWVPGCASGEEAYSLAMLLLTEVAAAGKRCTVQIFATDIDEEALQFARAGIYPESILADVGTDRLSRFFVKQEQGYRVSESLRKQVVFASQNLITDPPFSRMDITSCRNLLIYLDMEMQAKLIPLFNCSLNTGGYLFLGKSEGVGGHHALFETISKKSRIYRQIASSRAVGLNYPTGKKQVLQAPAHAVDKRPVVSYSDAIRQALLSCFEASLVLVDGKGQILQFHGQTGRYLNMPTGEPSFNLLSIVKGGLSIKIRSAMRQALREGKTVVIENVRMTQDESASFVRITLVPILRDEPEPLMAVVFEDVPRPAIVTPEEIHAGDNDTVVKRLEDELRATQQELQSAIEDLQASNEELRAANEEVVSTNEELQSSNEELETSKEELQSSNEELTTVNNQLQDNVETLDKANTNMANFLSSTQIATLFLDSELRIKLFTPAATRIFKLIPSDTGRPVGDLSLNFVNFNLLADAETVIRNGDIVEREALHGDGSSYLVRVMPYRTMDDHSDGVILTFSDVTSLRRAERQTRRLATVLTVANDAVILFDLNGNVQSWNRGAERLYGWSEAEALTMHFRDLVPAERASEGLELARRLLAGETIASFETKRLTKEGRMLDVWLTAAQILNEAEKMEAFATVERDITEKKRSEVELKVLNEALEQRADQLRFLASELTKAEQNEQHRLAQILHDGLQQILVGAKYQLALLEHSHDVPRDSATVTNLIDEAISTSRSLAAELSPPILHRGGLIAGLQWLADWMREKQGLMVNITVPEKIESLPESITALLFQAARELLFNVVKHAVAKVARVEVIKADGFIRLSVEDEGTGFDTERLTAKGRLNGIGLLNLRERLNMLGGQLEIDSSPGRGSRITIVIPHSVPTADIMQPSGHRQGIPSIVTESLRKTEKNGLTKIRVLLVDDHTIVRQGLAGLLRAEHDMEIVGEASEGESAVRLAREMRPDIVLMDINLPGMSGIDATRVIHQELPDVRVIGLSMFREGEQAAAMREAGAVDYIDKGGPADALTRAIRAQVSE